MTNALPPLAVVVKGWPRLSETFIAQELAALEDRGIAFEIWSLRFPTDKKRHPLHDKVQATVRYLPEYLHQEPGRVLRGWVQARRLPGYAAAHAIWRRDFARDRTRNRIRRFGQACVLAAEMPADVRGLYAHFLHTPSSVARYAAMMRGLPWSFSAHAKDIWTSPDWELQEKLAANASGAAFGVTCTAYGAERLRGLSEAPERVDLVYHGLDLSRFPPPAGRQLRATSDPLRILSVGRLVEKKGFDRMVAALALLPDDLDWHWDHIGGGPLGGDLKAQAEAYGIADRITWHGASDQSEVIAAFGNADVFVLPSRVAKDGDRDGLPNVLMEAASQRVPIIATPVAAIPEFIVDRENGLLVPGDDAQTLADAILHIAQNPEAAKACADSALTRLTADFAMDPGIDCLVERLGTLLATP